MAFIVFINFKESILFLPPIVICLNNSLVASDGQKLYFDSKDGKYGYNTDPNRGADTFFPFKGKPDTFSMDVYIEVGKNATKSYTFTFENLSEIYGIVSMEYGSNWSYIHELTITGNTIGITFKNINTNYGWRTTATITVVGKE